MQGDEWRLDLVRYSKPQYLPAFGSNEWKPIVIIESYNPLVQGRARNWSEGRETIAPPLEDHELYVDVEIVNRRQTFQPSPGAKT